MAASTATFPEPLASPSLTPSCPHPTNEEGGPGEGSKSSGGRFVETLRLQALPSPPLPPAGSLWTKRNSERAHRAREQRVRGKGIAENKEPSANCAEGQGGMGEQSLS